MDALSGGSLVGALTLGPQDPSIFPAVVTMGGPPELRHGALGCCSWGQKGYGTTEPPPCSSLFFREQGHLSFQALFPKSGDFTLLIGEQFIKSRSGPAQASHGDNRYHLTSDLHAF